jgi:hypothetical protein
MEKQDNLFEYMKELPIEEPSDRFTRLVMDRVRAEAIKKSASYQPLISKKVWLQISIGTIMLLLCTALLRVYFPGNDSPGWLQTFFQIDFSIVTKPFVVLSKAMSNLSITVLAGSIAISMLLLIDQLFFRYGNRKLS